MFEGGFETPISLLRQKSLSCIDVSDVLDFMITLDGG